MKPAKNRSGTFPLSIFWIVLCYTIAALAWWFITLENQNKIMARSRIDMLQYEPPANREKALQEIRSYQHRKTVQYIAEGFTFLVFILAGAIFIFVLMRRRLRENETQRDFMQAIAHELKTPIAVAKLNLETIQKHNLQGDQQRRLNHTSIQELDRLNNLCNNLLLSSKLETSYESDTDSVQDFSLIVARAVEDMRRRLPERQINAAIDAGVKVECDKLQLEFLVNNLLENAVKYSPKETNVTAELKNAGKALLRISDQGPGIPAREKQLIFEKHYRIGNEATKKAKGTGLGLYVVKKITERLKGKVSVEDNHPGGAVFTVELPLH